MEKINEFVTSKQKITEPNTLNDMDCEKTNTLLMMPLPNVLMLGLLFLSTIAIIIAGYIHGDMHFAKVLENFKK